MQGLVSFIGVAHPWMCDSNGHVNARHYLAMFDDASFRVLDEVARPQSAGMGWADARCEIDYLSEVRAGTVLEIVSNVERVGRTSLVLLHTLRAPGGSEALARARIVTVRFDLSERRPVALAPEEREHAQRLAQDPQDPGG